MFERNEEEVDIGYGIDKKSQNNGYMTEAVCVIIDWMFQQSEILAALAAETEKEILLLKEWEPCRLQNIKKTERSYQS